MLWFQRPAHWFASPHPKLIAVLPHDRGCRLQSYAHGPALVDKSALGGNPFDNILGVKIGGILLPSHLSDVHRPPLSGGGLNAL